MKSVYIPKMGIYFCKRPEAYTEPPLSSDLMCNSLTKWFGEAATLAHIIYLDDFSTSYISEVIRWKVCARRREQFEYAELVLKTYPRKEVIGLTFRSDVFFKNEIAFYENTLPELLKFQNSKHITDPFDNHLRLFLSYCDGKRDSLVFGNELEQGFDSPKKELDSKHAKFVLKTMAKFHAISFAMKDQNSEAFEKAIKGINDTYYSNKYWRWYKRLWSELCSVAIDAVEKEYPGTKYVVLIKKFAVPSRFKDLVKAANDKGNSVILHGDCSASNYLFKYDEEELVDMKMLDFQQTRCASPALDVCSLLYNNADLLKDEKLLKYYHETLSKQIKDLGSNPDIYKWDAFLSDVKKYSYFGVAVAIENATTTLTGNDILNRKLTYEWLTEKNIADIYEVKNLENKPRRDLANCFVHCVDKGFITDSLLESYMFYF